MNNNSEEMKTETIHTYPEVSIQDYNHTKLVLSNPLYGLNLANISLSQLHKSKELTIKYNEMNNKDAPIMSEALLISYIIYNKGYNNKNFIIDLFCLHDYCGPFTKTINERYKTADYTHNCYGLEVRRNKKTFLIKKARKEKEDENKIKTPEIAQVRTAGNQITKRTGYCKLCPKDNNPCAIVCPPQLNITNKVNKYGTRQMKHMLLQIIHELNYIFGPIKFRNFYKINEEREKNNDDIYVKKGKIKLQKLYNNIIKLTNDKNEHQKHINFSEKYIKNKKKNIRKPNQLQANGQSLAQRN